MVTNFYLVVSSTGSIRTTKMSPDLKFNEISIHLKLNLPNSLFEKPILTGSIVIPENQAPKIDLSPEMKNNIENALKTSSGVEVKLSFIQQ